MEPPINTRPYRSHKFPACTACRQRKIRCHFDQVSAQCTLCREKSWECVTASPGPSTQKRVRPTPDQEGRPAKRTERNPGPRDTASPQVRNINKPVHQETSTSAGASAEIAQPLDHPSTESTVIVGPVLSEDIAILGPYLSRGNAARHSSAEQQTTSSGPSRNPLLYLSVPRRRRGLQPAKDPGSNQKVILAQLVGPFADDVIDLYFEHIHPSFPILDELAIKKHGAAGVSSALWSGMITNGMQHWNRSDKLKRHPRPDPIYACNMAVAALQEDFTECSVSTVLCGILDMINRPVNSIVGNIINEGRTIALAQTFGMNRNPTHWGCSDHEKRLRIRTWWAVLINNRLSCLAHGTPPTTMRGKYDVPLPTLADLLTPGINNISREQGAQHFVQLCKLCEILGDASNLAYDLRPLDEKVRQELLELEVNLNQWEANLPPYLTNPLEEGKGPGACNLHFCFLSTKLMLARTSLRATSNIRQSDTSTEDSLYRLAVLRSSARKIADFVCALTSRHLAEFWFPYTAHLLASAAMILLRCTVETTDVTAREICRQSLEGLRKRLRTARDVDDWDLADIFLNQCDEPISRVIGKLDNLGMAPTIPLPNEGQQQVGVSGENPMMTMQQPQYLEIDGQDIAFDLASHAGLGSDLNFPFETLGYPFENLWSMYDDNGLGGF